jgi:hypothetical protein
MPQAKPKAASVRAACQRYSRFTVTSGTIFKTRVRYFFFSAIFKVSAAVVVLGFSFFGFFASLLLRC